MDFLLVCLIGQIDKNGRYVKIPKQSKTSQTTRCFLHSSKWKLAISCDLNGPSMGFGAPMDRSSTDSRNRNWVQRAIWRVQPWTWCRAEDLFGEHREPFKWYMRPGNRREIYRHFMKTQIENDESRCNQWSCTINVKEMDVDVACVVTSSLPALPLAESKSLLHVACDQCSRPSVILWLNTGWWIGIPNDSHNGLWSI